MKRPSPNRRAAAIAVPGPAVGGLWPQFLAATAIVAAYLAVAGALR